MSDPSQRESAVIADGWLKAHVEKLDTLAVKPVRACSVALMVASVALTACGGTSESPSATKPNIGSPNSIAVTPPATLSASERATFRAGEVVAAQSGCLACHLIGRNGNDGPGPPLTHEGSRRSATAIASVLRHPKSPMPSFAELAHQSPGKFKELVDFISMLR
jgi:ubiquinol-cytochrome c reductase cytochrome b subunit/menaquinol-cytochrome c reductase cytochrome b/c subunit